MDRLALRGRRRIGFVTAAEVAAGEQEHAQDEGRNDGQPPGASRGPASLGALVYHLIL